MEGTIPSLPEEGTPSWKKGSQDKNPGLSVPYAQPQARDHRLCLSLADQKSVCPTEGSATLAGMCPCGVIQKPCSWMNTASHWRAYCQRPLIP